MNITMYSVAIYCKNVNMFEHMHHTQSNNLMIAWLVDSFHTYITVSFSFG